MLTRFISAICIAPLPIIAIYLGGVIFDSMLVIVFCLMAYEWLRLVSPANKFSWYFFGLFYCLFPCLSLSYLRGLDNGIHIVFWLMFAVWATDIGAYIFGKVIGGPKIAPSISPTKTWAGLIGGALCAATVGYLFQNSLSNKEGLIILSMMIAVISQAGDFFESKIKRIFGVKDSGNLIPGHGGILDRVDGLITASIFIAILELYNG